MNFDLSFAHLTITTPDGKVQENVSLVDLAEEQKLDASQLLSICDGLVQHGQGFTMIGDQVATLTLNLKASQEAADDHHDFLAMTYPEEEHA